MIDFDNIKYIFQIPLVWYTDITAKVCKAYGQNFIRVKDGEDGGLEIGVDDDSFAQYIQQFVVGGGTVKSVDGVPPDASGNVSLGALTEDDIGVTVAPEEHTHTVDDIEGLPDFTKGQTTTVNVVEKVNWNGTTLTYDYNTLTFTKGILTGKVAHTGTVIDTPTVVTWK